MPAVLRGTAIGSVLGVLPGGGAALSSFAAYALEKKILALRRNASGAAQSKGWRRRRPPTMPARRQASFPLLTLGIPGNAIMALMVGAMMIQGIQPGPEVMTAQPQLFWGVIASMWLGNLMLIVLNLPLIGLWVSLLRVPYRLMFPAIVLFCCIGTYSISNSVFDVWVMLLFGVLGVFFYKVGAEPAPFVLGFMLGPLMEENFRRAMYLSRGDPSGVPRAADQRAAARARARSAGHPRSSGRAGEARGGVSRVSDADAYGSRQPWRWKMAAPPEVVVLRISAIRDLGRAVPVPRSCASFVAATVPGMSDGARSAADGVAAMNITALASMKASAVLWVI